MSDLLKYFNENTGRYIHKCPRYLETYDKFFSRYRGKKVKILEIGVDHGGSLEMWSHYFGEHCTVVGFDRNDYTDKFDQKKIQTVQGDQGCKEDLERLLRLHPDIDIVVDDGSHIGKHQILTFETLFNDIAADGLYIVEDLHTSYWIAYEGGLRKEGTFIEYSKSLIDLLNQWYWENGSRPTSEFAKTSVGIHFFPSVVLIEKGIGQQASPARNGTKRIDQ